MTINKVMRTQAYLCELSERIAKYLEVDRVQIALAVHPHRNSNEAMLKLGGDMLDAHADLKTHEGAVWVVLESDNHPGQSASFTVFLTPEQLAEIILGGMPA